MHLDSKLNLVILLKYVTLITDCNLPPQNSSDCATVISDKAKWFCESSIAAHNKM